MKCLNPQMSKKKKKPAIYRLFFDDLLKSSWRSVLLLWKPIAGWTFLVYLVFTALTAPLLFLLLDWSVFRGDRLFVGNDDLYTWFFSPAGFSYLFLFILILLVGWVIRFSGIFQIITDDLLGQKVSLRETALHIAPRIPVLVKMCVITVSGFVLLLIPLAIGFLIVHQLFLTEFDLNYYWYMTPPEWYKALTYGGIWAGLWAVGSLILVACLLPALPSYLDGNHTMREAVLKIWRAPMSETLRFLKVIGVTATGWITFRILADALLLAIFLLITHWAHTTFESLRPLAILAGGYLFTSITMGIVISFFGFSLISVIISKFYYKAMQPEVIPQAPGFRALTKKTLGYLTWWFKPIRAGIFLFALILGSLTTSYLMVDFEPLQAEGDRMITISHRANAGGAYENSLSALENSIQLGVDMAEIDVQLTADSVVVVWHDEDLMRMAGDPRRIADVRFSEISDLSLLSRDEMQTPQDRIATLEQFLEAAKGEILLMIELKYYETNPLLAEKTVELVRNFDMETEVVYKSLNYSAVQQLRGLTDSIPVGYVSAAAVGDISRLPIDFLSIFHQNVTPQLVRSIKNRDQQIYAWTVNDRDDAIAVLLKGVDGIITDDPEMAIRLINEIAMLSPAERILLQFGLLALETQSLLQTEE